VEAGGVVEHFGEVVVEGGLEQFEQFSLGGLRGVCYLAGDLASKVVSLCFLSRLELSIQELERGVDLQDVLRALLLQEPEERSLLGGVDVPF
jgi:hypothetical protein